MALPPALEDSQAPLINYDLASAEKGAQFAELSVAGTAAYLKDFIENVAVDGHDEAD